MKSADLVRDEMGHRVSGIRGRVARLSVASVVAAVTLAAGAAPASAVCDGPLPSFRDALSTATRIVIGDVVAVRSGGLWDAGIDGRSSRFTLRVRYVLRGEAPAVMEIRDLPTQPCAAGVIARAGDRIALAFDATDFTPPIRVNAIAWIRGIPPAFEGFEIITATGVFELLGQAPPDTATAAPDLPHAPPLAPFLLLVTGFLGVVLRWWRVRSRAESQGFRRPASGR